jgi:hypothetical protein
MSIDWQAMFSPEHSLIEIFLRGTMMSIVLFSILRFFMQRQSGVIGIADLLVIILIADAAQNTMANEYKSLKARFSFSRSSSGIWQWIDRATLCRTFEDEEK